METVLSCIQPTSEMHFGNYFGAVKNWVELQEKYRCIYGVVDYHAMSMPYDPKELHSNTINMTIDLLACGIDPNKAILFIQSLVPEHAELAWILSCFCSYGELQRMTQFKDKSESEKVLEKGNIVSVGLFTYPVLQAADILIYKAEFVPVGKDQEQHLELSRNIANRFNNKHGEFFKEPKALFTDIPKLLSLADPTKKMSKSLGDQHVVRLFEDEASIRKKVKAAVTDVGPKTDKMSPGVANLFELLKACNKIDEHATLMNDYNAGALKYSSLKDKVADGLVELSKQFIARKAELTKNEKQIEEQVYAMSEQARVLAKETIREVRDMVGLPKGERHKNTEERFTNDKYWWGYELDWGKRKREYLQDHSELEKLSSLEQEKELLNSFLNRNKSLEDFLGKRHPNYRDYMEVDALLNTQIPLSKVPEERIFVILHQMYELVFKQMKFDFEIISHTLDRLNNYNDDTFKRLLEIELPEAETLYDYDEKTVNNFFNNNDSSNTTRSLIEFWGPAIFASNRLHYSSTKMLGYLGRYFSIENFSGFEFTQFRPLLLPASGFQTEQFRTIQLALGKEKVMRYLIFASHEYLKKYQDSKVADTNPEHKENFTSVTHESIYDKKTEKISRVRDWERVASANNKLKQLELQKIVDKILLRMNSLYPDKGVVNRTVRGIDISPVIEKFKSYIRGLSAFEKRDELETEKTIVELVKDLKNNLDEDLKESSSITDTLKGASVIKAYYSKSPLLHVLQHLDKTDLALHDKQKSFLSGHIKMVDNQVSIVGRVDTRNGEKPRPGTGGGGMDYLNFMLELYQYFPAFPSLREVFINEDSISVN